MVLIPIHEGCAKTVCLINCNYFVYSSILLSMCPCPKLACVSEFHLARILRQSQNYDGNKCMYDEKHKVVISDGSNSLSPMNNKMPLYILPLRGSVIRCRQQISPRRASINVSADSNVDGFQPNRRIWMLYAVPYLSFLSSQSPGSHRLLVYTWKTSKFLFPDRRMCLRSYFKTHGCLHQSAVQFCYYLISPLRRASVTQVNIQSGELSNYL